MLSFVKYKCLKLPVCEGWAVVFLETIVENNTLVKKWDKGESSYFLLHLDYKGEMKSMKTME